MNLFLYTNNRLSLGFEGKPWVPGFLFVCFIIGSLGLWSSKTRLWLCGHLVFFHVISYQLVDPIQLISEHFQSIFNLWLGKYPEQEERIKILLVSMIFLISRWFAFFFASEVTSLIFCLNFFVYKGITSWAELGHTWYRLLHFDERFPKNSP